MFLLKETCNLLPVLLTYATKNKVSNHLSSSFLPMVSYSKQSSTHHVSNLLILTDIPLFSFPPTTLIIIKSIPTLLGQSIKTGNQMANKTNCIVYGKSYSAIAGLKERQEAMNPGLFFVWPKRAPKIQWKCVRYGLIKDHGGIWSQV